MIPRYEVDDPIRVGYNADFPVVEKPDGWLVKYDQFDHLLDQYCEVMVEKVFDNRITKKEFRQILCDRMKKS